jgi:hypothetical protein
MVDACCWESIAENPFYDWVLLNCPHCVLGTFLGTRLGTNWSFFFRLLMDNCQIALRWQGSALEKTPDTLLPPATPETRNGEAW